MKLREKIKRFWTLDVHSHEGFTLVELIIVIAILAILSSVAVVGYSSYVTKANIQADKTMVAEIANALTLYYYSNSDKVESAFIVLSVDDSAAYTGEFANEAMKAAYGDNWQTALKLKYNGWTDDDILSAALNREDIAAISGSPFLQSTDTAELLDNIQGLTTTAFEFLGDRTAENKFLKLNQYDADFVEFCKNQGLTLNEKGDAFSNASDAQLSNLMVLYAADTIGDMSPEQYESALNYMLDPKYGTENAGDIVTETDITTVTLLASQYAMLKAISTSEGDAGAEKMAEVDKRLSQADSMLGVQQALGYYFGGEDCVVNESEQNSAWQTIGSSTLLQDIPGITAMMGAASSASGSMYDNVKDLDSNEFYIASNVANAVNTVKGIAGMSQEERTALKKAVDSLEDGQVLVLFVPEAMLISVSPAAANAAVQ